MSFSTESFIRDKFLWPFSPTSIWNMPIGSEAHYIPANIQKSKRLLADQEYIYHLRESDPLRQVFSSPPNAPWGPGRCEGKVDLGISLHIPDDFIVPDATTNSTPNNASAFLMPDGRTLVQLEPLARCHVGKPIYGFRFPDVDIYGDGIGGSHFGSGLSAIGGSIRKGELINNQPIRHALKVLFWCENYLYYSQEIPGYRWPADRADRYAPEYYHGSNPAFVQGSLLAIPPDITETSLNLQTLPARKLFHALRDYGAYVVDDAGWDAFYFAVETGVPEEFSTVYHYQFECETGNFYEDVMKLFQALCIIDNNGPNSIGGGGTPRQPLAPPIDN